jgi:hypothetical protein
LLGVPEIAPVKLLVVSTGCKLFPTVTLLQHGCHRGSAHAFVCVGRKLKPHFFAAAHASACTSRAIGYGIEP